MEGEVRDYKKEEAEVIKLAKSCIKRRDYQEAIKYLVWADTFRFIQTQEQKQ